MYKLLIEKRVFRDLDRLEKKVLARIDQAIRHLCQNPLPPGAKKLVGQRNLYRIRQGKYRIIYYIDHRAKEVRVIGVRHRRESYR
jgi:mRNA interferase RelE/StbE